MVYWCLIFGLKNIIALSTFWKGRSYKAKKTSLFEQSRKGGGERGSEMSILW